MRHLLTLLDVSPDEIREILRITSDLKAKFVRGNREPLLPGRVLGLLFSKPSLRTRVSFEAAMAQLGGASLYLGKDVGWGDREPASDFGRVLSQYVDAIVCRTHHHALIEELAQFCDCPVINGLTDLAHPCQALADVFTIEEEKGSLAGRSMTFVGDGNNVARSLAVACKLLGVKLILAAPAGYEFADDFLVMIENLPGAGEVAVVSDPVDAVKDTDVVYTDVWSSMGQEDERTQRQQDFVGYQVNAAMMRHAPDAIFLHCLPARRGEEVSADVIDGPQSRIVLQAANRLHAQKAVLTWILGMS
jgi:ornithine carbamoyltransferase